ncbi:MAG: nodulation S family protein [Actinomycetota bacterium]|nr:nodulation S family protein [Actinomycetota bacterium]
MSEVVPRPRIGREFFEDLYAGSEDPWGFATSDYERDKYADTLAALGDARFARGLEVGASIGVFTEQLADRCDELVGIDVSERALARARERLGGHPGVSLERMTFPEEMPPDPWDLVVCSEILYYFDDAPFALAVERLRAALEDGATVLAVHWRPGTSTYPLRGDEVHDRLRAELGDWHAFDGRRPRYRLDRFEGH